MKRILLVCVFLFTIITSASAQFDKPSFQLSIGLAQPFNDLKGTYYRNAILGSYPVIVPDTNLYRNNYGAKTGFTAFGKAKINLDKYNIVRLTGGFSFTGFNTFEPAKSGNVGVRVINFNNEVDTVITGITYDYSVSNVNLGLGVELSPLSFTNVFSPYFGAGITFNIFSTSLSRSENTYDTTEMNTSDFRIGFAFEGGLEYKINPSFGILLGIKYDLGNILLKNTNSSLSDTHEWGRTNGSFNDEEGTFYSTIYNPVISSDRYLVRSKEKDIRWATIYVGMNFYLDTKAKSKRTPKK